jgi:hypothetical protein
MFKFKGTLLDAQGAEVCNVEGTYSIQKPTATNPLRSWRGQFKYNRELPLMPDAYQLRLPTGEVVKINILKASIMPGQTREVQFKGNGPAPSEGAGAP